MEFLKLKKSIVIEEVKILKINNWNLTLYFLH